MGTLEKEIGKIVVTEQAVYFILGILLGIPGSRAVRFLIEQLVLSESYTVSLVIAPGAYMLAFLICLGIAGVSCAAQIRYAGKISLTEVIKERES
jgi:putative ABC transport system permease protein